MSERAFASVLVVCLAVACQSPSRQKPRDDDSQPIDPPSTGTLGGTPTYTTGGTASGTPTTTGIQATLVEHGEVVCPDPDLRTDAAFDVLLGGNLPATAQNLQGAGMILADFTGDGMADLFIPGEFSSQYWIGRSAPDPADAELRRLLEPWIDELDLTNAVGGIAGDLNGDGWLDLVITRWGKPNVLLMNDGTGRFTDETPVAFATHSHLTQSATLADLDGDGDLDLFFGSYGNKPANFQDPNMPPAQPSELYRNDGNTWTDLSLWLPQELHDGYTFMSTAVDMDGDTLPELLAVNDFGTTRPTVLLWNRGNFDFETDLEFHPNHGDMGLGVSDVNMDGEPDFLFSGGGTLSLMASGLASGLPGIWIESKEAWNVRVTLSQHWGWGADWGDVENDGDLDAFMVFGHWDDWISIADYPQPDELWVQDGALNFERVGFQAPWNLDDSGAGRGLVVADWNQDGWLDVLKRQTSDYAIIHTARCGSESWIEVEPRAPAPNTFAIGAKVRVTAGGLTHTRWIMAGGTGQYSGQPPVAHVGLGNAELIDSVEVIWPDGEVSSFTDVDVRQRLSITRL